MTKHKEPMVKRNYFILITNDSETVDGTTVPALEVASIRLHEKLWPFYENTPNKSKISNGDICLIYLAGSHTCSQHVIGEFVADTIRLCGRKREIDANLFTEMPVSLLEFDGVTIYGSPISVKKNLNKLSFIPDNRKKWGAAFRTGCRRIEKADFLTLRPKVK